MRNILEALRLHQQARLSNRQIGQALGIAHTTVSDYLRRAEVANISYETGLEIGHDELERRLFPAKAPASVQRPQPDWAYIGTCIASAMVAFTWRPLLCPVTSSAWLETVLKGSFLQTLPAL